MSYNLARQILSESSVPSEPKALTREVLVEIRDYLKYCHYDDLQAIAKETSVPVMSLTEMAADRFEDPAYASRAWLYIAIQRGKGEGFSPGARR